MFGSNFILQKGTKTNVISAAIFTARNDFYHVFVFSANFIDVAFLQ